MTTLGASLLVGFLVAAVAAVIHLWVLWFRARSQRQSDPMPAVTQWAVLAGQLRPFDRRHVARANNRGRAARPELAAAAALRGRAMLAAAERVPGMTPTYSRFQAPVSIGLGIGFAVLLCTVNLWVVTVTDATWKNWLVFAACPLIVALSVGGPRRQDQLDSRWLARLRRSVELNDALAGQEPTLRRPWV